MRKDWFRVVTKLVSGACVVFGLLLSVRFVAGLGQALFSDAYFDAYNGTFQAYNPMWRIDHGQLPLSDFDAFQGLVPLGMRYAAYRLLCLWDSWSLGYVAAKAADSMLHECVFLSTSYLLFRWAGFARPTAALAAPFLLALSLTFDPFSISSLSYAPESSFGLRDAAAYAAAWIAAWTTAKSSLSPPRPNSLRLFGVLGACAGALVLWVNDFGCAAAAALGVFCLLLHADPRRLRGFIAAVSTAVLAACASLFALTSIVGWSLEAPFRWFGSNVLSIAGGGQWIYNVSVPVTAYQSFSTALASPSLIVLLAVLPWSAWRLCSTRSPAHAAMFVLMSAEVVSYLLKAAGTTLNDRYPEAMNHVVLAVPFYIFLGTDTIPERARRWAASFGRIVGVCVFGSVTVFFARSPQIGRYGHPEWLHSTYFSEIGGKMEAGAAPLVQEGLRMREEGVAQVVSVYRTIIPEVAGAGNPGRIDLLIHGIGRGNEAAFVKSMIESKAPYGITLDRETMAWENWNVRKYWGFYREFYLHYVPDHRVPYYQIWRLSSFSTAPAGDSVPCSFERVSDSQFELVFDASTLSGRWLGELELDYRVDDEWHAGLEIDETRTDIDAFISPTGRFYSLYPTVHGEILRAPFQFQGGVRTHVRIHAHGPGVHRLDLASCSARTFLPLSRIEDSSVRGDSDAVLEDYGVGEDVGRTILIVRDVSILPRLLLGAKTEIAGEEYSFVVGDAHTLKLDRRVPDGLLDRRDGRRPILRFHGKKDMRVPSVMARELRKSEDESPWKPPADRRRP